MKALRVTKTRNKRRIFGITRADFRDSFEPLKQIRLRGIRDNPAKEVGTARSDLLAFEELYKLHHRRVYAVCLRMTGNPAEAEDLSQEVVQVFRKLDTFRGESSFTTWLHRLTVNHVLMHFRKTRRRRDQLTEDGELPERIVNGPNVLISFPILDRIALAEAIVKLAPGYRAVFVLHDVEGLEHLEIANILGCAVGTSKSQLHKARMKMRRLLRQRSCTSQAATTSSVIVPPREYLIPLPSIGIKQSV